MDEPASPRPDEAPPKAPQPDGSGAGRPSWRHRLLGAPRDVLDPKTYHHISLIALLAWVGLGADGLSSSAYGPDEAFRALGHHSYLAVALALATGVTVLVISVAYSQIIKRFPFGGGGYVVATELQAFLHETFQPNVPRVSSSVRQLVAVNLAGKPLAWLALGLSGQLNADALTGIRGGAPRWSTDLTGRASAACGPFGPWTFDASQSFTRAAQPLGFSQTSLATAASTRFQPIERLSAGLEGRRSEDRVASTTSVRTVTHGATASTQLGILETLRASASLGYNRQDIEDGGTTSYLTGTGQARAQLRRDLELSLEASLQRTLARQGDTSAQEFFPLLRILAYQRYTAEVRWRPSQQLDLMARAGWSEAGERGGLAQSYRAGWQPFPGGAVQLSFDYSEDIDPLSGRSLRRFGAAPRWSINRHASLELSYNLVRGTGDLPVRQQNLYLTFSLKL